MIKDAVSPLEPRYEDLAGDGFGRKARRHFLATRPKFLTASVLPVLVGTAWGATVAGGDEVGLTSSRDVLEAYAAGEGPDRLMVTLGYAGWGPGQLEDELAEGAWYVVDGGPADVFAADPSDLWRTVLRRQPGDLAFVATPSTDPDLN